MLRGLTLANLTFASLTFASLDPLARIECIDNARCQPNVGGGGRIGNGYITAVNA